MVVGGAGIPAAASQVGENSNLDPVLLIWAVVAGLVIGIGLVYFSSSFSIPSRVFLKRTFKSIWEMFQ